MNLGYLAHVLVMEQVSRASARSASPTAPTPTSASTRSTATAPLIRRRNICLIWSAANTGGAGHERAGCRPDVVSMRPPQCARGITSC